MNKLITPCILTKYAPRKDKSVLLSFETQEKTGREISELHDMVGMYGALVFKPESQLTQDEINDIDNLEIELGGKTKAQRLRNVLYLLHKQSGEGEFKDFYAEKMESIINQIKNKLE